MHLSRQRRAAVARQRQGEHTAEARRARGKRRRSERGASQWPIGGTCAEAASAVDAEGSYLLGKLSARCSEDPPNAAFPMARRRLTPVARPWTGGSARRQRGVGGEREPR